MRKGISAIRRSALSTRYALGTAHRVAVMPGSPNFRRQASAAASLGAPAADALEKSGIKKVRDKYVQGLE